MNRARLGVTYVVITIVLGLAIWGSGSCWQTQNMTGLTNIGLRNACLAVWTVSGILLAVSQIAFLVLAVRMKHRAVLAFAACILLAIAGFVFLLSMMPS